MHKVEPVVTYKVWYKLNPEYDGTFQIDKIGAEAGLHATVTPSMGGLPNAKERAVRCKAWFNNEQRAVETSNAKGAKKTHVETKFHNNVIVWIEKYKDGYPVEEEIACPVNEPIEAKEPQQDQSTTIAYLKALVEDLQRQLQERDDEKPKKKGKKAQVEEPEEALAGV